MRTLKRAVMLAVMFAVCFTTVRLTGHTIVKAAGGELDRIVFDGDSTYDWSHFYSVDGKKASIKDLKITVTDKSGNEVPAAEYTVQVFATWWDDAAEKDVREEVTSPYKIVTHSGGSDGFCEFIAKATANEGSEYSGEIEATFHIMDKYCLEWICAETAFDGARKDGWRMCDRFFIDIDKLKAPTVTASNGKKLTEGKDYKIVYYKRADLDLDSFETSREEVLEGTEKLSGMPTTPGGYVCKMQAISPYYGGTEFLLDIEGEVPDKSGEDNTGNVDSGNVDSGNVEDKNDNTDDADDTDAKTETVLSKVSTKKISAGKKSFTLKWTPQTEGVTGYQIEYSTDKGFADNTKTVNVKGSNKAKKKIAKLEKRKVYYVRIRSYAKTGQSTSYSDWSKQLKVKTK